VEVRANFNRLVSGREIPYLRDLVEEGGQLWNSLRLVEPGAALEIACGVQQPAWSPDGQKIVLLRGNAYDREQHLRWRTNRQRRPHLIPATAGSKFDLPAASRGHTSRLKKIVFTSTRRKVWSPCATMHRPPHTRGERQGLFFAEEPVPAMISFRVPTTVGSGACDEQLYVIAMPVVGGSRPRNVTTPAVPQSG